MKTKEEIKDRLFHCDMIADDTENPLQKQGQAIVNALSWVLDMPDVYKNVASPRLLKEYIGLKGKEKKK